MPCTNNDNKSCMLELGKQNATAIYPTRDIIRKDGKIVHSHHAKPGDCLQHNLVGRAGRSLSCACHLGFRILNLSKKNTEYVYTKSVDYTDFTNTRFACTTK